MKQSAPSLAVEGDMCSNTASRKYAELVVFQLHSDTWAPPIGANDGGSGQLGDDVCGPRRSPSTAISGLEKEKHSLMYSMASTFICTFCSRVPTARASLNFGFALRPHLLSHRFTGYSTTTRELYHVSLLLTGAAERHARCDNGFGRPHPGTLSRVRTGSAPRLSSTALIWSS